MFIYIPSSGGLIVFKISISSIKEALSSSTDDKRDSNFFILNLESFLSVL